MSNVMNLIDWSAVGAQLVYDPKNPLLFSNGFFIYFFSVFIGLYFALKNYPVMRRYMFCIFSLYFFYKASGSFVLIVIASAVVDFFLSNAIFRSRDRMIRRFLLCVSIIFNLGLLVYFKYTDFFIHLSNSFFSTDFQPLHLLLPIGISFFTFENLSYTLDVYRGEFEPAKKFSDYLLFLSFFPKLMMGPIVRAHDFVPQINSPHRLSESDLAKGFYLIVSGLVRKLIISDYITLNLVDYVFDNPGLHTGLECLFALYGYAMVIYCDFSGYSDIAIGIALWLGFRIPPNFLSPYQSLNITEFWRRWHISLSTWLRDYLYIPLGGNRGFSLGSFVFTGLFLVGSYLIGIKVFKWEILPAMGLSLGLLVIFLVPAIVSRKMSGVAANFNLLTTMLLGGFWHGASWNFIFWGALHGVALGIHKIWILFFREVKLPSFLKVPSKIVAGILTFHFVCFCWIFFKASDLDTAFNMLYQIVYNFHPEVFIDFCANYTGVIWMIFLAMFFHLLPDVYIERFFSKMGKIPVIAYVSIFFVFLFIYAYFKSSEQVMPIYLQF